MIFRCILITKVVLPLILIASNASYASKGEFGWLEKVKINGWGVTVKAKLDTGALTSSMHAERIETYQKDGNPWVKFVIAVTDEATDEVVAQTFRRRLHRRVNLRGAGGNDIRPTVLMNLCIGAKVYETQVTLENRDDMLYPILLGRRILQTLGPVDVTRNYLHEPSCDGNSPAVKLSERELDEDIGQ